MEQALESVREPHNWAGSAPPGLSIILLHYNRPWCLEIATASLGRILSPSALSYEIILADDGSDRQVRPLLDALPFDHIFCQAHRIYDGAHSTVYDTILAACRLARHPYLLFLEDGFWLIPQGFLDLGKDHTQGLSATPDFFANTILGAAVSILHRTPDAHFVELARSYANPRYHCDPATEQRSVGIAFRAKQQGVHPRFYTAAWPHVVRTAEMRQIEMPLGEACWSGEARMDGAYRKAFGCGNWVYNPELCFFAHVNVFTWREAYNRAGAASHMNWVGDGEAARAYRMNPIPGFNRLLLEGFTTGRIRNDLDEYFATSPMHYVYHRLYRSVCP